MQFPTYFLFTILALLTITLPALAGSGSKPDKCKPDGSTRCASRGFAVETCNKGAWQKNQECDFPQWCETNPSAHCVGPLGKAA
jgi:hypothetical protein